jgi:hypothetical protein
MRKFKKLNKKFKEMRGRQVLIICTPSLKGKENTNGRINNKYSVYV